MDGKFIIDNLLGQKESDRLVLKYLITEEDLARIVTAMLNGKGGDIVIGIGDNKRFLILHNVIVYDFVIIHFLKVHNNE